MTRSKCHTLRTRDMDFIVNKFRFTAWDTTAHTKYGLAKAITNMSIFDIWRACGQQHITAQLSWFVL